MGEEVGWVLSYVGIQGCAIQMGWFFHGFSEEIPCHGFHVLQEIPGKGQI